VICPEQDAPNLTMPPAVAAQRDPTQMNLTLLSLTIHASEDFTSGLFYGMEFVRLGTLHVFSQDFTRFVSLSWRWVLPFLRKLVWEILPSAGAR
jgi:hypothetical protein